jgi:4-amino-4-deoxy-L-arabinose transferase-like glycosyltransferase
MLNSTRWRALSRIGLGIAAALLLFVLVFWNLDRYPLTWYDEGSHLHVPKTLVTHGVYADISSEGYRYYGPTVGVGPTVMLPIAGVFRIAGIGLLQARIIPALYLVAALVCFWGLAVALHGRRYAFWATALLASSTSVGLVLYGRQALGEVRVRCLACRWSRSIST